MPYLFITALCPKICIHVCIFTMVSSREYVHIMRIISELSEDFYEGLEMMCIFVSIIVFMKAWEGLFALEFNIYFVSHGYSIFFYLFKGTVQRDGSGRN